MHDGNDGQSVENPCTNKDEKDLLTSPESSEAARLR